MVIRSTNLTPAVSGTTLYRWPSASKLNLALCASLLCCMLFFSNAIFALELELSSNSVALNKTLRMTIKDRSSEDIRDINLQPLEKDFVVGQPSISSEISIVNGRQSSQQSLTLSLQPKRLGIANIPPLRLGNKRTKPQRITVTEAIPNPSSMYNGAVKVEASLSKRSVYQSESFVYTLKVLHRVALESTQPQLSLSNSAGDATIDAMPKKEYQEEQNGIRYAVQEWRFFISLNTTGRFTIPSPVIKGELYEQSRSFFRSRGIPFEIEADAVSITVNALPANVGTATIVADSLTLTEVPFNKSDLKVGQPITRKIEIQAKGNKAEQLPAIDIPENNAFNIYKEPSSFNNEEWLGGFAGTRRESFAIIPTVAGKISLPAVSVDWFNATTGQLESSVLPEITLNISPAPVESQANNTAYPNNGLSTPGSNADTSPVTNNASLTANSNTPQQLRLWQGLFAIAVLAWLVTLVMLILSRRQTKDDASAQAETPISSDGLSETSLRKSILKACSNNDALEAKRCALKWRNQASPNAITPDIDTALRELDRVIFSASQKTSPDNNTIHWQGSNLASALRASKTERKQAKPNQLKALYPASS